MSCGLGLPRKTKRWAQEWVSRVTEGGAALCVESGLSTVNGGVRQSTTASRPGIIHPETCVKSDTVTFAGWAERMWHHKCICASFAAPVRDTKQSNTAHKGVTDYAIDQYLLNGLNRLFIRGHTANDSYGYIYFNRLAEFQSRFQTAATAITRDLGNAGVWIHREKKTGKSVFQQKYTNGPMGIDVTEESWEQLLSENLYPLFLKTLQTVKICIS